MTDNTLVTAEVAAQILGVEASTLREWRHSGFGPPFVRHDTGDCGPCYYRVTDLNGWLALRAFNPCIAALRGGT